MQPQEEPVIKIGQLQIRYLMDGTLTGAGLGMFELTVPGGVLNLEWDGRGEVILTGPVEEVFRGEWFD